MLLNEFVPLLFPPTSLHTREKKQGLKKARAAFKSCADTGIIDNMDETFPSTSSGTQWSGFTDTVMGGMSMAHLTREQFEGRTANVLRGHVSLKNNGGFIQMATNLGEDAVSDAVDASHFDGVEIEATCKAPDGCDRESFNVQYVLFQTSERSRDDAASSKSQVFSII